MCAAICRGKVVITTRAHRYAPVLAAVLFALGSAHAHATTPVIEAAKAGDVATLRTLVRQRADVNAAGVDGSTALLWAVSRLDVEAVRLLLAAKADPDAGNRYGITPLLHAARVGHTEIARLLLDAGSTPEAAVRRGETPLMAAAGSGNTALVDLLLARGADPNARESEQDQTALIWAVTEGHADVVRQLLAAGADPDLAGRVNPLSDDLPREGGRNYVNWSRRGLTPLMIAAREGHLEVARLLVEGGAEINVRNPSGLTPMLLAVANDFTDLAAMLLERGADPDDGSLHEAVQLHNLRHGATAGDASRPRMDHPNDTGPVEFIAMLLDRGADPNRVAGYFMHSDGASVGAIRSPAASGYARALQAQDVAVLKLMLDRGRVDPNVVEGNMTPLMLVSAPLTRGGLFTGLGDGPFRHVSERGSVAAAELLIAAGADVRAASPTGDTALHRAAQTGELDMIRFLAARGAALDARNAAGLTPLDYAMGKRPPGPPAPGGFGGPPRPQAEAVALLRELMGMPADGESLAAAAETGSAGN